MPLVDETLTINRPILEVFDFLSNHENYALWFPDVVSIISVNDLPHGSVGKVYSELIKLPAGRSRHITIDVVESQSPVSVYNRGKFSTAASAHGSSSFREVGAGKYSELEVL